MELQQGVLAVKICELAKEYGLLQSRIQICQEKNPEQLQQILEQINDECKIHRIILEQNARYGRLSAAAALAQAQLTYEQQADKLLTQDLMHDMYGKNATVIEDSAEACTLYAEYAIDFATQAMRYALAAAIQALELQIRADQNIKADKE